MRLAEDFLHPGMPSLNMVVGSGLMLIEIVPVNQRSFQEKKNFTQHMGNIFEHALYLSPNSLHEVLKINVLNTGPEVN